MKHLSKILPILLALSLCMTITAPASTDVVKPTEDFYVADYANVLSSETEQYIIEKNDALYASCGGQFCVVTIDFLNDLDAEQYSYALFNEWKIGGSENNNGTLLLMVVAEDKYWLSCGGGIEDVFTAGKMNTILMNEFEDDFLAGNCDAAAVNTADAVIDWYESYYGRADAGDHYGGTHENHETYDVGYRSGFISFRTIVKIIFIAAILIFILGGSGKTRRTFSRRSGSNLPFWLFMSSMNNAARRNRYYHTHHRTGHRPPTGGFGSSGGFRSSGGGFRSGGSSFRSGGGGFGRGGGAGRK